MRRLHSYEVSADRSGDAVASSRSSRLYSVCVFDEGLVVPWVKLLDATSDTEAIGAARCICPSKRRELWDRHRLVAEFR
ncbi:MAG: hypothetical protein ACJ8EH_10060 [Sphingomicrobium sp.]